MKPFSIVIPTLNEEKYIGGLLESIRSQTLQPQKIVIADFDSTDKTIAIAKNFDCQITNGGNYARGRNSGAALCNTPIIIFLDADTKLPTTQFLSNVVNQFEHKGYDLALSFHKSYGKSSIIGTLSIWISNIRKVLDITLYKLTKGILGGSGGFIIVKFDVFNQLKGFDETLVNSEDTDFILRALKHDFKFGIISKSLLVSTRRFNSMNLFNFLELGVNLSIYRILRIFSFEHTYKAVENIKKARNKPLN